MSDSYSGEKTLQRQRVCSKCISYVTHEKVNEKQFACPLCGNRINISISFTARIGYEEIQRVVADRYEQAKKKFQA